MREQQGFALVTVLMVVVVLMILGTSILYTQTLEMRQTLRQEQQVQAHYLARSGLEVGLRYLKGELSEKNELSKVELVSFLEDSISETEEFRVAFEKRDDGNSVDILSIGIVKGRISVEDTIRVTMSKAGVISDVDKALGIPWVDGVSVAHIRNDTLPKNPRPVLIEAKNHIKTSATHYLQAPAIQFRVQKEPGSNGLTLGHAKLYLTADFISFDSDVEMKNNAIVLDYLHGVTDEDGKEYGIVHFGGLVYKNSHQHAVKNLAKYYLFEKGTELTADTIPQGLKPLDENSDLFRQVFTFGLKDDPDLLDEQYTFQYASGS